ncbi:hypothetical protein B0H13DRAFT_1918264 [Mycena leptocephala]|nr:hypothetical protein B0H13DRAFT_1918264 [Mycena leptocephala]
MGRHKKTGKASVNVSALPGTDTLHLLLKSLWLPNPLPLLESCSSYSMLTGATPSLSSGVAMSAAAPIPFRCLSKREETGEDRGVSDMYSQPMVLSDLFPQYLAESKLHVEADISRELDTLHPRHLFSPCCSAHLTAATTRPAITRKVMDLAVPPLALQRKRKATPTDSVLHPPKQKRVAAAGATGPIWFRKDGELAILNSGWSLDNLPSATAGSTSTPDTSSGSTPSSSTKQPNRRSCNCRGGRHLSKKQGKVNPKYIEHMRQRSMACMDIIKMDSFSIQYNASHTDCINEFEEAIQVIVGRDDRDPKLQAFHAGSCCGPHLPNIRTSLPVCQDQEPFLTAWHVKNQDRVDNFMALPIIKRIIGWVSNIMLLFFPGLCARIEEKACLHGIQPLFGYFWNLCVNACFEGQGAIMTDPHADSKNQIGLVMWEAGVALELLAWVLAADPSALFFHFNMDIHHVKWVTVDGNECPTPENSQPLEAGDSDGHGSLVFFNQAAMRTLTETGHPTMKEWCANGGSRKVDFGNYLQRALENYVTYIPMSDDMVEALGG